MQLTIIPSKAADYRLSKKKRLAYLCITVNQSMGVASLRNIKISMGSLLAIGTPIVQNYVV